MKIIVTHDSPDWDGITSIWLIKKFLAGWEEAEVKFVPAGERLTSSKFKVQSSKLNDVVEKIGEDEVIHVDTGLGPLDHHQTASDAVSAASLTLDFVERTINNQQLTINKDKMKALRRIVRVVVDVDHFKEALWPQAAADYHEFSLLGVLDGLKLQKPNQDNFYVDFGIEMLDALLHNFENRIWAEKEIAENGIRFSTKRGKGIGLETINDEVLKLAQKMGYALTVRKDPRKGYVRIKARPDSGIDLTLVFEKVKKMDSAATWFLHVSKKMLLNGTVKNPKMRPTKLSLKEIIEVLKKI